jgi:hypothetical protein
VASVDVAVAVEVEPQPGAGSHVHQHDVPTLGRDRRQRRHQVGAAADLVHLVAVLRAELEQPPPVVETEVAVQPWEAGVEGRLRLTLTREPAAQRPRLELED